MDTLRKFVLIGNGRELVLPITPESFSVSHGVNVQTVNINELGDAHFAGYSTLSNITLTGIFPANAYDFATYHVTDPYEYVAQIKALIDARNPVRFLVSGTDVNLPVLVESMDYGEQDGTNDVYYTITLSGYRYLSTATVPEDATEATATRAVETQPEHPTTYTVVKGDTLGAIARKYYGDTSMAYKLATANGIKNPNLIRVGQVINLPDAEKLKGYSATKGKSIKEVAAEAPSKKPLSNAYVY